MILVELMDVQLPLLDEVVVRDHGASKRTHETRVAGEESEKTSCVLDDVPRGRDNTEERDEQGGTEDVDILGI